jgi:CRISPR/Cas system type I-B associated protein Csh2 (Cas7 group RAMP superfamily)
MIKIIQNANFSNWIDIRLFGKLIDNAKTESQAMEIAKQIQKREKNLNGNKRIIKSYV